MIPMQRNPERKSLVPLGESRAKVEQKSLFVVSFFIFKLPFPKVG